MDSFYFVENLLVGSLRNLSHTFRFDTLRTIRSECVAEHSFYASAYTLILYHKLIDIYPDLAEQIDLAKLLSQAICHDMEERLSGDITRCFKELVPNVDYITNEISRKTFEEECLPTVLADHQENAFKPDTIEGRLLKLADILCVCAKLLEEAELGNQYANNRLQVRMADYLDSLIRKLKSNPSNPFDEFAYRIIDNTQKVLHLRCTSPAKAKRMHTGW